MWFHASVHGLCHRLFVGLILAEGGVRRGCGPLPSARPPSETRGPPARPGPGGFLPLGFSLEAPGLPSHCARGTVPCLQLSCALGWTLVPPALQQPPEDPVPRASGFTSLRLPRGCHSHYGQSDGGGVGSQLTSTCISPSISDFRYSLCLGAAFTPLCVNCPCLPPIFAEFDLISLNSQGSFTHSGR